MSHMWSRCIRQAFFGALRALSLENCWLPRFTAVGLIWRLDIWGWALGGVVAPGHCEVLGGDGLDCVLSLVAQLSTYTRRSRAHTTTTKFDFLPTGMFERPLDHRKRLLRRARQQVESSRISDLASRSLASGDGISGPHSVV